MAMFSAYRYHLTRMHALPLDPKKKQKEWKTIQTIAKKNNIPQQLLQKLNQSVQQKTDKSPDKKSKKIWTTFTYHSPKIRTITNLFKNTNINIAFRTTTTTQQYLKQKKHTPTTEYEKSGIYKIACNTCHKAYVGQTSRSLKARYQEHTRYIKNNDPKSAYALHILNNRHEYGKINDTMSLLKPINEPQLLLPFEQMYMQALNHNNELIPEQQPNESNPLFELIQNKHITSWHT